MSPQLQFQVFQAAPEHLPLALSNSRRILRANSGFWNYLNTIPYPAAILSVDSRLVLANLKMLAWMEIDPEKEPAGAPLANLSSCLAESNWYPRTRQVEILGQAFFLMTIAPIRNPDCDL